MDKDPGKAMQIVSGFLDKRVKQRKHEEGRATEQRDFLDVLLHFESNGRMNQLNYMPSNHYFSIGK